jgi:hypothetical protein
MTRRTAYAVRSGPAQAALGPHTDQGEPARLPTPVGSTPRPLYTGEVLTEVDRTAARRAKRKASDGNPQRGIVAHGAWVFDDGRALCERALAWSG